MEQYARLTGLSDDTALSMYTSMLLTGPAAVWLHDQNWNWNADGKVNGVVSWEHDFKPGPPEYFCPLDYKQRAYNQLASCCQTRLDNVSGYVTAFRRCANRVADLQDAEALDHFVCGLYPVLRKVVLLRDPHTCKEAIIAVERLGAIHNYVTGRHSFVLR